MRRNINLLFLICLTIAAIYVENVDGGVTEEQMWATANLMREVCLPKFPQISKETANGVRDGNIPDDKDVKCYINCVLEMMQTMKKGKLQFDSAMKQIDLILPDDYKDEYRTGIAGCKSSIVGIKEKCTAAHTLLLCLHSKIKKFIFP